MSPNYLTLTMRTLFSLAMFLCAAAVVQGQYAGRYTDGKDYAVYFQDTPHGLSFRPALWTATQLLRAEGKDRFLVVDRASRGAEFTRDEKGRIVTVAIRGMDGEGLHLLRADGPILPIEHFLAGRVAEALKGYLARGDEGRAAAIVAAEQVLRRMPTRTRAVVRILKALEPHVGRDAKFQSLLGYALVQAGDRDSAIRHLRAAHALDPNNKEAISALYRLKAFRPDPNDGWMLPFALSAVFAKPTADEIAGVEKDWATRDLRPSGVKEELRSKIRYDNFAAEVRVLSHLVNGFRHYGVVIIPEGIEAAPSPVIIEAKGVSPTYFPLTLENLTAPEMMGDLGSGFIYVVPTYRGERLELDGKTFTSEGDRTDALDGATDDAIALLSVALATTPQADPNRICAFGRSRGGTVAMLAGFRDKRVDCVVNWSGPTDWFYLMGTQGWTEEELWSEALRTRATPTQTGGQNVERFLSKAIAGKADLAAVRQNMIASSPLYFARRMPLSQHHYGLEDPFVPSRNGYALVDELRRYKVPPSRYKAFFYPDQGHDTDRLVAPTKSREFIAAALGVK